MQMNIISAVCFLGLALINGCAREVAEGNTTRLVPVSDSGLDTATFAGGCYWCMDAVYEKLDGVKEVISGFSGGHVKDPSYNLFRPGPPGLVRQ